ncbi:unnamed protein product [Amoebophrya sp. A25]|nr:unnamed protein product [Amoebophrya sp. A25]|eukprot:GSA25T00015027001.1
MVALNERSQMAGMGGSFLERLEAEAVPLVEMAKETLPKSRVVVDLREASTAEPSRDHSSASATTDGGSSVSEGEERPLSASLARHRALLQQVSSERKEQNLKLLGEQKKAVHQELEQQQGQPGVVVQQPASSSSSTIGGTTLGTSSTTTGTSTGLTPAAQQQRMEQETARSTFHSARGGPETIMGSTMAMGSTMGDEEFFNNNIGNTTSMTRTHMGTSTMASTTKQAAGNGFAQHQRATGGSMMSTGGLEQIGGSSSSRNGSPSKRHQKHDEAGMATTSTELMTTQRFDQIQLAQSVENANLKKMLSTPRTLQACKELGIVPNELHIRQISDFAKVGDPQEKMKMRFQHFEGKRQEKLRLVLEARSKIIAREFESIGQNAGNFYSLQLMEDILDQEAKRLAKKLKQEVRLHAAVEKENEVQLLREQQVREKAQTRNERRRLAELRRQEVAEKVRQRTESKLEHSRNVRNSLEEYERSRQAQILAVQFEDEIRVREFQAQKELEKDVRNEQWEQRVELVQQRNLEKELEREIRAETVSLRYEEKLDAFEERRKEELKQQMVRHEAEHLKVVDAVERKERLMRIDAHRREKVGEQIAEQHTRIDSLMQLKQQLLEQRRQRNRVQDAKHGSVKSLNIKHLDPGPGAYDVPSTLNRNGVGRLPDPKPLKPVEGSIQEMVMRTKENPPPGSYDPKLLPSGSKVLTDKPMSMGIRYGSASGLDKAEKAHRDKPGPGTYNVGGNFKLQHVANMGKSNDLPTLSEAPKWVGRIDRDLPGPGAYAIDEWTRRERTARVMSTMPNFSNLGGAMAKAPAGNATITGINPGLGGSTGVGGGKK